jgi:hypothetical protein
MRYQCGDDTMWVSFGPKDGPVRRALTRRARHLTEPVFGAGEQNQSEAVAAACTSLLELLATDKTLTTEYILRYTIPGQGAPVQGHSATGFRINGIFGQIEGGVGRCVLNMVGLNEQGKRKILSSEDITAHDCIVTDNVGKIEILTKGAPSAVPKIIAQIQSFALDHPSSIIVIHSPM